MSEVITDDKIIKAHNLLIASGCHPIQWCGCYTLPALKTPSQEVIEANTFLFENQVCHGFVSYLYMQPTLH